MSILFMLLSVAVLVLFFLLTMSGHHRSVIGKAHFDMLFIILLFSIPNGVFGQITLKGKVIVDKDSLGVPGVTINIKGTTISTQTDVSGNYRLHVPDSLGNVKINLVAQFVGYTSTEISLDLAKYNKDTPLNFALAMSDTSLNQVVLVGYTTNSDPAKSIPTFPWPPPDYTALSVLNNFYFRKAATLFDAANIITTALDRSHYDDHAYFYIPNGFAIVTRIEQIREDGIALDTPLRWSINVKVYKKLTWDSYFKALIFPAKGYFRIIVFAVTNTPFNSSGKPVTKSTATQWLKVGLSDLPASIGDKKYRSDHRCTAIIYEFKKEETKDPQLLQPGTLTGKEHLSTSTIMLSLNN